MKIAVMGGVRSTDVLIGKLHDLGFLELRVWGYSPAEPGEVSGWVDLGKRCKELGIAYQPFRKVAECEAQLIEFKPDILFAVGLSQLLPPTILRIARQENIGFHPTPLPRGRGRAALAWLVIDGGPGAATFFGIREGVDDGPIYVQRGFDVIEGDDASSVEAKMLQAERDALDEWLPLLASGKLVGREQEHDAATWYGRRAPEDGWVDWSKSPHEIVTLVRASTRPHPGARTACGDARIKIWKAEHDSRPIKGVNGRIVDVSDGAFTVQAGDGLVRVIEWSADAGWAPRVGSKLGYCIESELVRLRERCSALERRVDAILQQLDASSS